MYLLTYIIKITNKCNIKLLGWEKPKMHSIAVFDHPQQVYIALQTTKHEFDITIIKLYNIMPKYLILYSFMLIRSTKIN